MKWFLVVGLGLTAVGCSGETNCEDYANRADPDCKAEDTASDTALNEDSADTGGESEADFTGTIEITVVLAEMSELLQGCTGVISIDYDEEDVDREMTGSFTCTWETELGQRFALLAGEGVLEGNTDGDSASGTAWYGPIQGDWEGLVNEEGVLTGGWSDHQDPIVELGLPEMDHSGTFAVPIR
jgi:hypothetical protein